VSQIWSLMGLLSMVIILAPNSTPMVRSWTGWKRLSVNCSSRHDLPTPAARQHQQRPRREYDSQAGYRKAVDSDPAAATTRSWADPNHGTERGSGTDQIDTCVADDDVLEEVGVRHLLLVVVFGWQSTADRGGSGEKRGGLQLQVAGKSGLLSDGGGGVVT
jgi:hypothetical protein